MFIIVIVMQGETRRRYPSLFWSQFATIRDVWLGM